MEDLRRPIAAEFIGTFALVFVTGATILNGAVAGVDVPLLDLGVAYGITMALLVSATMRFSGHLNPAVTIGLAVTRRLRAGTAVVYIVAQLMGAVVAALVLNGVFPASAAQGARLGGQWLAPSVSISSAILVEALATFLLVFAYFGTIVDTRGPRMGGFGVGLAVLVGVLAIGPLTGASMNPARSFGPALISGYFSGHFVYWIGPLLGGILAALVYDGIFLRPSPAANSR
ncbi:MAG TPA: aquaporin [Gemmatimonadaceae bacterium]|jgi:MIP family channel proteins|nr:aquaporin [Gemmatimonadaceae bacterium]